MAGRRCDGCQQTGLDDDCIWTHGCNKFEGDLNVCPDCNYAVCEDCICHACSAGERCGGIGPCSCGSCNSEVNRQLHPTQSCPWQYSMLPPFNRKQYGDLALHHNRARGTCLCPNSNFGRPYYATSKGGCYKGARGGAPYKGVVKSLAQVELEDKLLRGVNGVWDQTHGNDLPWFRKEERTCAKHGCTKNGAAATLRCARCRSVWYCSKEHQKEDWLASHKEYGCGKYVPASAWSALYVSEAQATYRARHGYHVGERIWGPPQVPKLQQLAMTALRDADHPLVRDGERDPTIVVQRAAEPAEQPPSNAHQMGST